MLRRMNEKDSVDVAIADFNNDGRLDVVFGNGRLLPSPQGT